MLKVKIDGVDGTIWVKSWAAYHPTADAHEQEITVPAGTTGADVDGKYFTLWSAGDETKFAVWYNSAALKETTTILCVADIAGSLGGSYFTIASPTNDYYVWMSNGVKQVSTLTCGTALQFDQTGTKEVNTLTASAASDTDMTGAKQKDTLTVSVNGATDLDMTGTKELNTLVCGAASALDSTGTKQVSTLTSGAASDRVMTGAKQKDTFTLDTFTLGGLNMTGTREVNTITTEADTGGSLNSKAFHFWALDGNNGTDEEYYVWFNVAEQGVDPAESGTGIEVAIEMNDNATTVATAVRLAINTLTTDNVAVTGATDQVIITGDYYGVSTACSDGTADTGWASFVQTTPGVDILAGDYITFSVTGGLDYYAWFSAIGAGVSDRAPSLDPGLSVGALSTATGIKVEAAWDATNFVMADALYDAIVAAGISDITMTDPAGASADVDIESDTWGLGTTATLGFTPSGGAWAVSEDQAGVATVASEYMTFTTGVATTQDYYIWFSATGGSLTDEAPSTDPAPGGIGILVSHAYDANAAAMSTAVKDALDAAVTATDLLYCTISEVSPAVSITNTEYGTCTAPTDNIGGAFVSSETAGVDITAGDYFQLYVGSAIPQKYHVWFSVTDGTATDEAPSTDPAPADSIGIPVSVLIADTDILVGAKMKAEIDTAISTLVTTAYGGTNATVTVEDDTWGVGTVATLSGAPAGFSVGAETAGVDITAGDYFTFFAGTDNTEYYAWFNAEGGSSADEAPSTEPVVATGTGIEITHSYALNQAQLAARIKEVIDAVGITDITVTADATTVAIENTDWGLGTTATENIDSANFSIAETQAGVAITDGDYLTFATGLTGSETDYYVWFNATGGALTGEAPSTEPTVTGTGIQVDHAFDATANDMADAIYDAIDALGLTDVVLTDPAGVSADVVITNVEWGVGVTSTTGSAPANFSISRTPGVNITAGEYFTFSAGVASEVDYYAWFSATGGAAAGTAPSTDPAVADATGIKVEVATGADAVTTGAALKAALDTAAIPNATIAHGGTNDIVTITNTEYGAGTTPTKSIANGAYTVAETAGVADSTDPALGGLTGVKVNFPAGTIVGNVAIAINAAMDALDDFDSTVDTNTVTVVSDVTGDASPDADAGTSGFTVTTTVQGVADDTTTVAPKLPYTTLIPVTIGETSNNDAIALATKTALIAVTEFAGSTVVDNVVTVINADNGECTRGSVGTTPFTIVKTVQGNAGYVPGSTSGDYLRIVGKIVDIDTEPYDPNRFKSVVYVAQAADVRFVETDAS